MIRITVPALPVRRMKGIGKTSQKPYDLQVLTIYAHTQDANGNALPFPEKTELMFDADEVLPVAGEYTLSPASLFVDRQGRLAVAPKLLPIRPKATA